MINNTTQNELERFFSHDEIRQIIFHAQACLFIPEMRHRLLCDAVLKAIRASRIAWPSSLSAQKEKLISQLLGCLEAQKKQFLCQLGMLCIESYKSQLGNTNWNLISAIAILFQKSYIELFPHTTKNKFSIKIDEECKLLLDELNQIIESHKSDYRNYRFIGSAGMVYCVALALIDYTNKFDSDFQLRNVAMFLLAAFVYYKFSTSSITYTLSTSSEALFDLTEPWRLPLQKIEIMEEGNQRSQVVLIPAVDDRRDTEACMQAPSISVEEASSDSLTEFVADSEKTHQAPQQVRSNKDNRLPTPIHSPLQINLQFPEKLFWFGKDKPVSPASLTEMRFLRGATFKVKRYAYFNASALIEQGVSQTDREWKDHASRIQNGFVVGPEGQTGIKQLNPCKFFSSLKVGHTKFENILFTWETKTLRTTNRLLGRVAYDGIHQGERVQVIDFCYNLPRGLGH